MLIRKTMEYIFEPDEADAAEVFGNTTDPLEWEEDEDLTLFPRIRFTKRKSFFVSDTEDFFSEMLKNIERISK